MKSERTESINIKKYEELYDSDNNEDIGKVLIVKEQNDKRMESLIYELKQYLWRNEHVSKEILKKKLIEMLDNRMDNLYIIEQKTNVLI